jgi:hypothetical protein
MPPMSYPSRVDDEIDNDEVDKDDLSGEEFLDDDDDSFGPSHYTYQELEEEEDELEDAPSPYYPGIDVCIVRAMRY